MYNNISKVFERTVLNPDFVAEQLRSHENHQFSFETVFYRTPYSYRCCLCAYQHEHFDYLLDKDDINQQERLVDKALFEQIIQNIANRRCPHARHVETKYLATSAVFTNHILAATGSTMAVNRVFWTHHKRSSIFELHPYLSLMLKNSCHILDLTAVCFDMLEMWKKRIMYPIKSKDNHQIVHWGRISLLEIIARKGGSKIFQNALLSLRPNPWHCNYMSILYNIAFKYELQEVLDSLVENGFKANGQEHFYDKNSENRKPGRLIGAEAAIVYNRPKMLDWLLQNLAIQISQVEKETLLFVCSALQRVECREVFLKYGFPEQYHLSNREQQTELFHLLLTYSYHWDEIISIIQRCQTINLPEIGSMHTRDCLIHFNYNCFIRQWCCRQIKSVEFMQLMILQEKIDLTKLTIKHLDDDYRELVELCLYSNLSNLDYLAEQTVSIYLQSYDDTDLIIGGGSNIDLIFKESHVPGKIGREYTLDAKEHFLFSEEHFALNFILPLFIECGVPLKSNLIDSILYNERMIEKLHPSEKEYLIRSLECPRSLQLCCRDTLRRHFKNRHVHRYMSISNTPNTIKDFVLLKTVLPTLKYTNIKQIDDC